MQRESVGREQRMREARGEAWSSRTTTKGLALGQDTPVEGAQP